MPTPNENTNGTGHSVALINVPGLARVSAEFKEKVVSIAADLGTNPNFLLAVMSFESGGTFSPAQKNFAGSGAVGLIQFMPATARALGTTTANLSAMTAEDQLEFVAKYFAPFKGKLKTIEDTYMAVLFPKAVGQDNSFVLFEKPSIAYKQNAGLDLNRDGKITKADAADKVRRLLGNAPVGTGELLRRGSQGPEVEKLQDELIDLGYLTLLQKSGGPGKFGPMTERALKNLQADNHIAPHGLYDAPTQSVISQVNEGVRRGTRGDVVRGLQDRLIAVGLLTIDQVAGGEGIFGPKTEAALVAFQRLHGLAPTGVLTDETYRALKTAAPAATHLTTASNSKSIETVLPASGIGFTTYGREPGGKDQFGRASTIRTIQELGEAWHERHPNQPFAVGDIARRGGGLFPPHKSHGDGLNFDMRPLTNNGVNMATNVHINNYSHALTRELVLLLRERVPRVIILFNDPRLIAEGLTRPAAGHDNHLHVRLPG